MASKYFRNLSRKINSNLHEINPEAKLCEVYGITECSPLVSINYPENIKEGTIGKIMPSIEYAIIDPESGRRIRPGCQGILLVRGSSIFTGYLNDNIGKGFCEFEGKLWYQTEDFVKEDRDRTLTFCGRQKRFIKLAGEMISLPAIENVLLEQLTSTNTNGPELVVEAAAIDGHPEIVLFSTLSIKREIYLGEKIQQIDFTNRNQIREATSNSIAFHPKAELLLPVLPFYLLAIVAEMVNSWKNCNFSLLTSTV